MKAVIENGGFDIPLIPNYKFKTMNPIRLRVFNIYLNIIFNSSNVKELKKDIAEFEFNIRLFKIENPFTSGFTSDGFGVYEKNTNTRKIFVECEPDLEM